MKRMLMVFAVLFLGACGGDEHDTTPTRPVAQALVVNGEVQCEGAVEMASHVNQYETGDELITDCRWSCVAYQEGKVWHDGVAVTVRVSQRQDHPDVYLYGFGPGQCN